MSALRATRETERLRLHPWAGAFAPALAALNADPAVMRHIGDGRAMDGERSAAQSRRLAAHWERFGFGLWAAEEKATGQTVGFVGLSHPLWLPGLETSVEVGWRLLRSAWGRGLATEGGREAVRAASDELGLTEVISLVHPDNARSLAVARKLGLKPREELPHPLTGAPLLVLARRLP